MASPEKAIKDKIDASASLTVFLILAVRADKRAQTDRTLALSIRYRMLNDFWYDYKYSRNRTYE